MTVKIVAEDDLCMVNKLMDNELILLLIVHLNMSEATHSF